MELELKGVTKTYPNGVKALDAVTLTIPHGMFGLLGPNGAGKSSLMRSLATLQAIDSGTMRFGDIDIAKEPDRLRDVLGYLPQDFGVYPKVTAFDMLDHLAQLKGLSKRAAVETVFEIHDGAGKTLGTGMRYDALSKRIGLKKEVPAVGMQLVFQAKEQPKVRKTAHVVRKPKFYFIQLGFDAKLKSLKVIEMLRQAKVPLFQSLSKDKLIGQMTVAENLKIPYTIIMGQKEAMENTVIVRNMTTRSQETIRIDELPGNLDKVK